MRSTPLLDRKVPIKLGWLIWAYLPMASDVVPLSWVEVRGACILACMFLGAWMLLGRSEGT